MGPTSTSRKAIGPVAGGRTTGGPRGKEKEVVPGLHEFPPLTRARASALERLGSTTQRGDGVSMDSTVVPVVVPVVDVIQVEEDVRGDATAPLVGVDDVREVLGDGKDTDGVSPKGDVADGSSSHPHDTTSTIGLKPKVSQPALRSDPQPSTPLPKAFSSLFRGSRLVRTKLHYIPPTDVDDGIEMAVEDRVPVASTWGYCLVGSFTGRFPGVPALDQIRKSWGVSCRMAPVGRGWTVFRFLTAEDRDRVYEEGPYMVYGKTLVLKVVEDDTVIDDDLLLDVPVWVRFYGLPPAYWTESGISRVASKLGRPVHTDSYTHDMSRVQFARALVEVDLRRAPISDYRVRLPGGRSYIQHVEYEGLPEYCYQCKSFDHSYYKCKASQKAKAGDVAGVEIVLEPEVIDVPTPVVPVPFVVSGVTPTVGGVSMPVDEPDIRGVPDAPPVEVIVEPVAS